MEAADFILLALVLLLFLGIAVMAGYPHRFWCPARRNARPNGSITIAPLGEISVACCARCNMARVRSRHGYLVPNDVLNLDRAKQGDVTLTEVAPAFWRE